MNNEKWIAWKMHTSTDWTEIRDVLKLTKIDFIDNDHKILVENALKLNRCIHAIDREYSLDSLNDIKGILKDLYDYAVIHFNREETFMDRYNLPNIEKHELEHLGILDVLRDAIDQFNRGKVTISHELKKDIMNWLISHINDFDYNFFKLEHWKNNLINAKDWEDIQEIISLIGIHDIDDQHQDISQLAVELCKCIESDRHVHAEDMMNNLIQKVEEHFNCEEDLMIRYEIVDAHHLALHAEFLGELRKYAGQLNVRTIDIGEFKLWLLDWWINHINSVDYEAFLPEKWMSRIIRNASSVEELKELLRYTHIDGVDDDHIKVIEFIFRLSHMMDEETGQQVNPEILNMLGVIYKLAEHHFKREELIMERNNLIDYKTHSTEHRHILEKLSEVMENYKKNRLYASNSIKNMILDWWINHTNTVDYRTFVINVSERDYDKVREEVHFE